MNRKRLLTLMLAAVLGIVQAWAYSYTQIDGIYYSFSNSKNEAVVDEGPTKYTGIVIIPSSVTYNNTTYSVTSIGYQAFWGCSSLTSITIPNSVTSIGNYAFVNCWSLTSVTIPNSVTTIGDYAFEFCSGLTSVTIGNSVTSIGGLTFYGCKSLTSVTIPNSVTSIGVAAFKDCNSLTSVTIPNSVTSIGRSAFEDCSGLTSVTIPNSVTSIEELTFSGCSGLTAVDIPNCVTSIGSSAFFNCTALTSVTIPNSVTSIGDKVFANCSNMIEVTIGNGVTDIGKSSFENCAALTSLIIGSNVTNIGDNAFKNCSGLENVTIYASEVKNWFAGKTSIKTVHLGEGVTTVSDGTRRTSGAFQGCTGLEHVTLPSTLQKVADYMFSGCSSLSSVDIPNNVDSIGSYAFSNCSALTSVIIPNSVTSIGQYSFRYCDSLRRVYSQIQTPYAIPSVFNWNNAVLIVPKGKRVDYKSVTGWSSAVIFEEGETIYNKVYTDEQGINYTLYQNDSGCYYSVTGHTDQLPTEITVLDDIDGCPVTTFGSRAFYNCTNLTKVTLPASLTSIDFSVFNGCTSLTEFVSQIQDPSKTSVSTTKEVTDRAIVRVPVGTKAAYLNSSWKTSYRFIFYEPGEMVYDRYPTDEQGLEYTLYQNEQGFYYTVTGHTDALAERVTIPQSLNGVPVTGMMSGLFKDCTEMKYIFIPESIKEIPNKGETFKNCSLTLALNQEIITGWSNMAFITGLELGDNVKTIGASAFSGCTNLTTVDFPESLDSIGHSAFSSCTSLERVKLPDGIKYLNKKTFYSCTSLTSVVLPAQLLRIINSSLHSGTFEGCTALQSIVLPNILTSIGQYTFSGCSSLTSFTIPENVASIGECAFQGCSGLTSVTIECPNVYSWFKDFTSIKNITLGEKVKYIGTSAFSGCTGLASVTIPNSVTSIGSSAFNGCTGLISVSIGNGVTSIDSSVFSGCTELASIKVGEGNPKYDSRDNCDAIVETASNTLIIGCKGTVIPTSVQKIGSSAFYGCTGLTAITLPNNMTGIGYSAFSGCTSLQNITSYIRNPFGISAFDNATLTSATLAIPFGRRKAYQKASGWGFQNIEEMAGNEEETTFIQFADATVKSICVGKWDENGDGEISLYEAKQVTSIPNSMFSGKTSITSFDELKLFSNITTIGGSAFSGCKNLTSITLPSSLTTIGQDAFRTCTALTSIELPEGLLEIQGYAFPGSGLLEMTLPSTLTYIGSYALAGNIIYCRFATPISVGTPIISNASSVILYVPQGSEQLFREATGWKDFLIVGEGSEDTDWAEGQISVDVEEAGYLRLALVELDDEEITRLKIRGRLNSVDIKYLIEGKGKIANLESLDLGDVTLVYDNGCYMSTSGGSDVGFQYFNDYYYLSEEEYTTVEGSGLGISSTTTIRHYSPNLIAAFSGKTYKHVVMPGSIKKAAGSVFSGCQYLQQVEFPGGLNCIGGDAFYNCKQLESINLENVDSVYHYAFEGCKRLRNVNHLENVKYIGVSAFEGCSLLTGTNGTLSLPHLKTIPGEAFSGCISLKKIHLPNIRSVGNRAFYGCISLATVVLPDELTTIGDEAFANCKKLQAVNCPASLRDVNYTCFSNTPWMNALPTEGGVRYWDAIALSSDLSDGIPTTFTFREGTTMIAARFLESIGSSYRDNVTALSLPTTLKYIGKSAFTGNNLSSLTLPENIDSIGENAFNGSKQLTKVTIPEGVTQIGESAFSSCGQLMIVNYNAREAEGKNFFYGCSSLEKVNVGASVRLLPQGIFYSCGNLTLVKFAERTGGIPLTIGDEAFNRCQNLASIALPQGTTAIGSDAFYYCQSLTSLPLPSSVKTIGDRAFYYCKALTAVTLSSSLKSIGDNAFNGCTGITSLALPSALESIGKEAFKECTGLSSCAISNKVTVINNGTFGKCSKLTSVTLPKGLKVIGDDAFSNCEKLSTIELPTKLDSIGCCAFGGCTSLRKIVIPATVTKLGSNFLYDCINMDTIVCHIAQPKDISGIISLSTNVSDVYLNYIYSNDCYMRTNLIVPDGCKPLYQATEGWKKFKKIREESGHEFTATNKLAVYSSVALAPGKTARMAVRLQNSVTDFVSFSFDFEVRRGFSIAPNGNNQPDVRLSERCPDGMTVTTEQVTLNQYYNGVRYHIVCESPQRAPIHSNDGPLLYITLRAVDTYSEGSYQGTIDNIRFTQANGTTNLLDFVPFWVKVDAAEADRTILDENAVVAPTMATGVDVRVFRHFDAVSWNTICLPFAISSSELERATGYLDLADFQGWDTEEDEWGNTIGLNLRFRSFWGEMEANHPYLLKVWKDVAAFDLNGIDLNPASDPSVQVTVQKVGQPAKHGSMTGTYTATTVPTNCFYIKDDGFHYSDGSSEIKGFRAWFNLDDVLQDKENPRISIFINDRETSISGTPSMKQDDDAVYDLSGRKIVNSKSPNGTLPKGIYIVNGKKVLVK